MPRHGALERAFLEGAREAATEAEARQQRGEAGEPDRAEFVYYDAQTGQVLVVPAAPDVRRWYRIVEDAEGATEAFRQGEFPLIVDAPMGEAFLSMPDAERDALMGALHWEQYGRPGAPWLDGARQLQRALGLRSDAARPRDAALRVASARPVAVPHQPPSSRTERLEAPEPWRPPPPPQDAEQDPLMRGLREPLFPLHGAQRFLPQRVTDIEPLDQQLDRDRLGAESWIPEAPRPNELLTPRDADILRELERQERLGLPAPTETARVPLAAYLRALL